MLTRYLSGLWLALLAGAALAQAGAPGCPDGLTPKQVLQQLNALRTSARQCGGTLKLAAPALQWDERLARSARHYAEELAQRDALSHVGVEARSLRERLAAVGYRMSAAGENLAAGPLSLDETLQLWMDSPSHCENLMAPTLVDAGLACVAAPGRYERFWVLHLGRSPAPTQAPRSSPDQSP